MDRSVLGHDEWLGLRIWLDNWIEGRWSGLHVCRVASNIDGYSQTVSIHDEFADDGRKGIDEDERAADT